MLKPILIVAVVSSLSVSGAIAQETDAGKRIYETTCVACHGGDAGGSTDLGAPALAGQFDWYLVRQLRSFREGLRGTHPDDSYGQQMRPMANALAGEQAIADVAAYISSLDPAGVDHEGLGDAIAGEARWASCGACHGPAGQGNEAVKAPRLDIQQDWYLVRQLMNFKSGIRGAAPGDVYGSQMRPMAQAFDRRTLENLVAYVVQVR